MLTLRVYTGLIKDLKNTLGSQLQHIHLTVGITGVGIYSIEGGGYKVFDYHARDVHGNSHSERTCVLLEIPSMHKLV